MKLTRFERKIIAAILAVALLPFLGTIILGRAALLEAYKVGVNPRVQAELDDGLDRYRDHFLLLRAHAELTADAVAGDAALLRALAAPDTGLLDDSAVEQAFEGIIARYENVAQLELERDGASRVRVGVSQRLDESQQRLLILTRTRPEHGATVLVTVAAPVEPFLDYQRAGEVTEVYSRLEAGASQVTTFYLAVYIGFLLSVMVVAVAVGVVASRRVTGRVADLAAATARVGAGDLTVEIPTSSSDEVGELTRAFNAMVRDLRQSRERIEYLQRIGAWQDFARRLAHEIKNPLTPIQLAAQEVERGYTGDDPKHRRKLEEVRGIIEEEVATLRRLVSEFSDFAKLPRAELAPADLAEFLADLSRSLPAALEVPDGIAVTFVPFEESLTVSIDAMMLKRGVDNLVRNAVEALAGEQEGETSSSSSRTGEVVIRARRDGARAIIEVCDDGPGIDDAERAHVFDPYFTTKSEGTGLGLAIVKKVILEHGGEIGARPREGGGTCFEISIPVIEEAP